METDKSNHIDTFDFRGNRIVCSVERWFDHIIHRRRHSGMEGLEDLIIEALQKPFSGMRYHDTDYPNRISYYGNGAVTKYIKVTVEFKDNSCAGEGFIVTTFPTNNMKPLEQPEWIR